MGFFGFVMILKGLWTIFQKHVVVNTSNDEFSPNYETLTGRQATIHGLKLVFFGSLLICFAVWYEEFTSVAEYFGAPSAEEYHQELREEFCQAQEAKGKKCILDEK